MTSGQSGGALWWPDAKPWTHQGAATAGANELFSFGFPGYEANPIMLLGVDVTVSGADVSGATVGIAFPNTTQIAFYAAGNATDPGVSWAWRGMNTQLGNLSVIVEMFTAPSGGGFFYASAWGLILPFARS